MLSLQNSKGNVVQISEGFSLKFFLFGPFNWLFKGMLGKFFVSAIKCCFVIPWIRGFKGGYNRELLEYYLSKGYTRI
jgi:hypothetical protein